LIFDGGGAEVVGGSGVSREQVVTPVVYGQHVPDELATSTSGGLPPSAAKGVPEAESGGFTVRLDNFTGPFDLLLQLIGKHKLDVTEVALHQVTDDFIAYIRAMGDDWDLGEASEFLLVAATLLDLKAARLLPPPRSRTRKTWPCWRRATCCSPGCCNTRPSRKPPHIWPSWRGPAPGGGRARFPWNRGTPRRCPNWSWASAPSGCSIWR